MRWVDYSQDYGVAPERDPEYAAKASARFPRYHFRVPTLLAWALSLTWALNDFVQRLCYRYQPSEEEHRKAAEREAGND